MGRLWRQDGPAVAPGALLVALVVGACGGGGAKSEGSRSNAEAGTRAAQTATEATTGPAGTVRLAIDAEPASLNPDLDPDEWAFRLAYDAIYEPLVRPTPTPDGAANDTDGAGYEPVLATSYAQNDERIYFKLREGVRWQDGQPFTSADVVCTFQRLLATKRRGTRSRERLADLAYVEPAGRQAVRFVLRRPSARALQAIAEVGILPEHLFGHGDFEHHPAARRPVGTGPLQLASWERGRRLTLRRWEGYWGQPAAAAAIQVDIEPDGARALGRARRGELDWLARVAPLYVPDQLDTPSLKGRFEVVREHPSRFAFVLWNVTRPPLTDPAVRRALASAIDRQRLLDEARNGLGRAVAVVPTMPEPSSEPERMRGDLKAAAAALDAAGLGLSAGGQRLYTMKKAQRPVRLALLVPDSREAKTIAKEVSTALGELGIKVDSLGADLAVLRPRLERGDFDGAVLEWAGVGDDDLAPIFHSRREHPYGGFASPEVDALLDGLRQATPGTERHRDLDQRLATALAREAPALFLYAPDEVSLYGKRLRPPRRIRDLVLLRDVGPR